MGNNFFEIFAVILVLGVIFVNGWTDAPNAITSPVCSGVLSMKSAIIMAAVCNFLGVFISSCITSAVAKNIFAVANTNTKGLCAAMTAVIILAVGAWFFGIPTSESHAIIAALCGASVATGNGVSTRILCFTLIGLILSVMLGFALGYILFAIIGKRDIPDKITAKAQVLGAGFMALMHGAQDGQKFISIFVAIIGLSFEMPLWVIALCSSVMALGTALGGGRIIRNIGKKMVSLDLKQGFCADIAGGISLFLSTALGMPVSTTHAKTAAVMGCGFVNGGLNKKTAGGMLAAWVVTFPVCFLLGFLFCKLF